MKEAVKTSNRKDNTVMKNIDLNTKRTQWNISLTTIKLEKSTTEKSMNLTLSKLITNETKRNHVDSTTEVSTILSTESNRGTKYKEDQYSKVSRSNYSKSFMFLYIFLKRFDF